MKKLITYFLKIHSQLKAMLNNKIDEVNFLDAKKRWANINKEPHIHQFAAPPPPPFAGGFP